MNNPLKDIDPDGENPILIAMGIGALIGGTVGLMQGLFQAGATGDNSLIWKYALVGAVAGVTGGAFAGLGAAAGITGILPGMAYGATTGAITSVYSNALMNVLTGRSITDNWQKSLINGAISGGISGGFWGMINADMQGRNLLTGTGEVGYELPINSLLSNEQLKIIQNSNIILSDEYLDCYSRSKFGLSKGDIGIQKITNMTPKGYSLNNEANFKGRNFSNAGGITKYKLFRKCEIYISPGVTSDNVLFKATLGHELGHVWNNYYDFIFTGVYNSESLEHNGYLITAKYLKPYINQNYYYKYLYLEAVNKYTNIYPQSNYSMPPFYYFR